MRVNNKIKTPRVLLMKVKEKPGKPFFGAAKSAVIKDYYC
jgi:hypothetical protein